MSIRLHLNPPRRPSPRLAAHHPIISRRMERRDIYPHMDRHMIENIIYSIETSIHNVLLSQDGSHALSKSEFPRLQIIEPLRSLCSMFRHHYAEIETHAERSKIFEKYEIKCNRWVATCHPPANELGKRVSRLMHRLPSIDHAYVLSFSGFNLHLSAAEERLSGLSTFLTSVLYPVAAAAEDLTPMPPDEDLFPYATEHAITLPEGTPTWKVQLQRYGVEKLGDVAGREAEKILTHALQAVVLALKLARKCRLLCEVEGQRAGDKNVVWEDWRESVLAFEEEMVDADADVEGGY